MRKQSSLLRRKTETQGADTDRAHGLTLPYVGFAAVMAAMLFLPSCGTKEAPPAPGPVEVVTTDVVQKDVPTYGEWVAQLNGTNNADITPKVQGYLLKRDYQEGFFVNKGQLLFEIDPRPFQAALDQAEGEVASVKANLERFQNDVERDTPLAAQNAIPQKQLDNDRSSVSAFKARLDAANAQVEQAKLSLAWTKVYSPFDGIAGVSNSQIGDLVGPTTKMTTVSQIDPIRAYFNISETAYLAAAPRITRILRGDITQQDRIEYIQANGEPYPYRGKFILVNRQVTAGTGTIQLAGEFPNKDAILRPGGFGKVRIQTGMDKGALLVPQRAVIEVQSAYQVAVVGTDNKASFRSVKVGDKTGDDWIITDGLKPGDKIIVEGFMKVRDGMPVSAKPYAETASAGGN